MIWRRVLVPESVSLRALHGVVQLAVGWERRPARRPMPASFSPITRPRAVPKRSGPAATESALDKWGHDTNRAHQWGAVDNRGREAPKSVGSNGEIALCLKGVSGDRGERLDVQPSMSATLTPRILVLPSNRRHRKVCTQELR